MVGVEGAFENAPSKRTPLTKDSLLIYPEAKFLVQVDSLKLMDQAELNKIFSWSDGMWDAAHRDVFCHGSLNRVPARLGSRNFVVKRFVRDMILNEVASWAKNHDMLPATLIEACAFAASRQKVGRLDVIAPGTLAVSAGVTFVPILRFGSNDRRLLDSMEFDRCHASGTPFLLVGD
jgi:hypothetical protein